MELNKTGGLNIISFSLWGDNPIYTEGAIANAILAKHLFPGWVCYFNVDSSVPAQVLEKLSFLDCCFNVKPLTNSYKGLFWRYNPLFNDTIYQFNRVLVRDCDSRLSIREADAVKEWVDSGLPFHVMRDHKLHKIPILGGTLGGISFHLTHIGDMMDDFIETIDQMANIHNPRGDYFNLDQMFLCKQVWPLIKDRTLAHDTYFKFTGKEIKFKVNNQNIDHFIGCQFDNTERMILR